MFKDVFVLSKNSWHLKLMKYMWGFTHKDFSHICPYFWLSIFNVIISPIFLPVKFIIWNILPFIFKYIVLVIKWIMKQIIKFIEHIGDISDEWALKQQQKWEEQRLSELKTMEQAATDRLSQIPKDVLKSIKNMNVDYSAYYEVHDYLRDLPKKSKLKKFVQWLIDIHKINPEVVNKAAEKTVQVIEKIENSVLHNKTLEAQTKFQKLESNEETERKLQLKIAKEEQQRLRENDRLLKEQEKKRKQALRDKEKADIRIKNKQRIVKILKIVKPIATIFIYTVGVIVALIGLYLLFIGIKILVKSISLVPHTNYVFVGTILKWVILTALAVLLIIVLIKIIIKIVRNIKIPNIFKNIKIKVNIPIKKTVLNPIGKMFVYIYKYTFVPIRKIFVHIGKFLKKNVKYLWYPFFIIYKSIKQFIQIFIQTAKDKCPLLEWKDKN